MIQVLILGAEELGSVGIFGGALYFGGYKPFSGMIEKRKTTDVGQK